MSDGFTSSPSELNNHFFFISVLTIFINFDLRTIDLFRKLSEEQQGLLERVKNEYTRIKENREDKPLRLSMYTYMDERLYSAIISKNNMNIFRDYLSFLEKINELNEEEKTLIGTKAHEFAILNSELVILLNEVIAKIVYVLEKVYKVDRLIISNELKDLIESENIKVDNIDVTNWI